MMWTLFKGWIFATLSVAILQILQLHGDVSPPLDLVIEEGNCNFAKSIGSGNFISGIGFSLSLPNFLISIMYNLLRQHVQTPLGIFKSNGS